MSCRLFCKLSSKSSVLDPIPAILMKEWYDTLLSVVTQHCDCTYSLQRSCRWPILKKDSLDHEVYKNFRPISNLSFISKATEKVVAVRLNYHLEDASLHEIFQSAYKKGHSTETALTRIHNDILRAIDDGECVILVLLDLSAAFDTVDHDVLITRLKHRFEISGKALGCMDTVLSIRKDPVRKDRNWALIEPESLLWCSPRLSAKFHPVFHVHLTTHRHHQ